MDTSPAEVSSAQLPALEATTPLLESKEVLPSVPSSQSTESASGRCLSSSLELKALSAAPTAVSDTATAPVLSSLTNLSAPPAPTEQGAPVICSDSCCQDAKSLADFADAPDPSLAYGSWTLRRFKSHCARGHPPRTVRPLGHNDSVDFSSPEPTSPRPPDLSSVDVDGFSPAARRRRRRRQKKSYCPIVSINLATGIISPWKHADDP